MGVVMIRSDLSRRGSEALHQVTLRIELRKLADHSLDALGSIRTSAGLQSPPASEGQQLTASDPELRDIEQSLQDLVGAISVYLFK